MKYSFIKQSSVIYQNFSYVTANNFYHEWMIFILLWGVCLSGVLEENTIRSYRDPGHSSVFKFEEKENFSCYVGTFCKW